MPADPRPVSSGRWLSCFRELGAVWEAGDADAPHVKTSLAGAHVDKYFNSDAVLSRPELTAEIVRSILQPELLRRELTPAWIVGYAPFGLFLAHAAAHALRTRCAYSDPTAEYDTYFDIQPADPVLVVADDMYSGGSVAKTITQLQRREATVLPIVFCLVNLSGKAALGEREIVSVGAMSTNIYPAEECPLCKQGSPALTPRPNWHTLLSSSHITQAPTETTAHQAS
jgi:orotate phosphoribosyltransferase